MEQETQHGGCLCGKVRYIITKPRIYGVVCHCKPCRHITGSSFVTADIYPRAGFTITLGASTVKTYISDDTDSGTPLRRNFCSECGSQLFALTALNDDIVSVCAGSLDRVAEWKPTKEQYCGNKASWVKVLGGDEEDMVRYPRALGVGEASKL